VPNQYRHTMEHIIITTKPELQQIIIEAIATVLRDSHPLSSQTPRLKYLNTVEAAEIIKKSPGALRQIVHRGEIPSIKRGNTLLFLETDLAQWIEKGRREVVEDNPSMFLKKVINKKTRHI
jgi:excisionase family DNA binding protein